jgi:hypothetical protein
VPLSPFIAVLDDVVANPQVLRQLGELVHKPSDVDRIKQLIENAISSDPSVGNVKLDVKPGFDNASYNMSTDTLTTGLGDPAYMAHELGHVENTRNSPIYQKFLTAMNGLAIINQKAAIPLMLGLHAFTGDATRRDAVNTLSGISAALAGPVLMEEASATANAVMNSPDKGDTLRKLAPAFGSHAIANLLPILMYRLDRSI